MTTLGGLVRDSNPSNPHPHRFESVESKIIESCPPLPKSTNKNYYFMVAVVTEVEAASLG